MKSLQVYGAPLVRYEGAACLAFPGQPGIVSKGYFEATQLTSGAIVIGFMPIAQEPDGSKTISRTVSSEPSLNGRDPGGWEISTCGQTLVSPLLGIFGPSESLIHSAHVFPTQGIVARRDGANESGYVNVRFLVSNLLWHYKDVAPEPITLEIGGFTLTVTPIGDYMEVADRIKAMRGIAPTAQVSIKASEGSARSLKCFGDFMNDLVSVFRLATGNRVDWYYGEAFEVGTETIVERYHKDAVTGPFSRVVGFRPLRSGWISKPPKLNFKKFAESLLGSVDVSSHPDESTDEMEESEISVSQLVEPGEEATEMLDLADEAFNDNDKKILDRKTLNMLIDYFVNACDETSYLEARGILASTLLDLIVLKYAKVRKADNILEEEEFKRHALPTLKEAIKNVDLLELTDELRVSAMNQLGGAYRRSFRERLKFLTKELDLPLDHKARGQAVCIRNKLVHEGTYPSNRDDWFSQYKFMIWVDWVALCRLAGYGDPLPSFMEGGQLEV